MCKYKTGDKVLINHPFYGEHVVTLGQADGPKNQPNVIDCFNIEVGFDKTWVDVEDIIKKVPHD